MQLNTTNLIKCGFFPENIPQKVFSMVRFHEYMSSEPDTYNNLERNLKDAGVTDTPCAFISCYKNDYERRIMAIPHIETYILLAQDIESNMSEIESKLLWNENSYSNEIQPNEIDDYEVKSTFYKNYLDRIRYALGYKYLLNIDISKCYENIYTHSITWALMGKENAKSEYRKKLDERSTTYKKFDKLDQRIRAINNNETKGISTGPITSRIISEIILTEVDREIRNKHKSFKRYVDDYNFFFKTSLEAEAFLPKLQRILYEFKLHINSEKTELLKYPYSINHNLSYELGDFDFKKHGYVKYIERVNELFLLGNKAALKYGVKVLKSKTIDDKEKNIVFAQLINLMVSYPNLAEYIYAIFINNKFEFDEKTSGVMNEVLHNSILNGHHIEVIWLVTFLMRFDVRIDINSIIMILEEFEVLSCILILDYISNNRLMSHIEIKRKLEETKEKLKNESIYGDKWLLIYESIKNNWIKGIKRNLNKSKLLRSAMNDGVAFYISPLC